MPDEFQTLKKERSIEIIKACNGSGMPKRQWCREHGISYSTFMRWQRILRNELAGEIMVTQAVVPLQIEPQASRCTPAQEVTIQKDGISISMHGVSSDTANMFDFNEQTKQPILNFLSRIADPILSLTAVPTRLTNF
ncbi:helix-turn-helix domain-containing protein [Oscillospiraceae bacterium NTUH-002-81]|nr:helix-turn-helix domain-containing protein [Oscillospiraceae bacterium NTUH-002-81]